LHKRSRSDRRCNWEEFRKQSVEDGKGIWITDKACDLDDAPEAAPGVFENGLQIRESLACLGFKGVTGNVSGRGIDSGLAGGVDEVADTDGLRVRADPGDARAFYDFRWQSHSVVWWSVEAKAVRSSVGVAIIKCCRLGSDEAHRKAANSCHMRVIVGYICRVCAIHLLENGSWSNPHGDADDVIAPGDRRRRSCLGV